MSTRRGVSFFAVLSLLVASVIGVLGGAAARASNPPSSTVTVPTTAGQTEIRTWTGTIPAGANPTSSCSGIEPPLSDEHEITITVTPGTYDTIDAAFKFTITWGDATHDEILTVLDPEGEEVGSSDGGTNVETVNANNLPGSSFPYRARACPFAAAVPVDYQGKLEITTTARSAEPSLPSAPARGLEFSASVAADNQRDEAEPLLEIDKDGHVYDCGPTGFSNLSDYAQVSPPNQGGDQFHMLGSPPRGQQSSGGGGDCGLAFGTQRNSSGNYQYAYTGLGPLTGFATSTSPNNGKNLATGTPFGNGVTDKGGGADRQWMTFVGAQEVLLIYNQQVPRNVVVQRSTDGGLTYGPLSQIGAASPRFPGPIRYIEPRAGLPNGLVYFPFDRGAPTGDQINIAFSTDKGLTWRNCGAVISPGTTTLFATADHDSAGNIYIVYGENAKFHTYMISTSASRLRTANPACNDPSKDTRLPALRPELFSAPVQVDRDAVRSTVFQWVTAGGAPGRVAVVFAGTETDGNPNSGTFKATWNIYVNQSLNANSTSATFSQVKATTHPFHYDSICLNGLGCDLSVPPGDRSMADFFSLDYSPADRKIYVTFDRSNKMPDEELGHVASPMVVTQIAGPSLGGGTLTSNRPVLRNTSGDPTGDALSNYSVLAPAPPPPTMNEPAGDFRSAAIGPEPSGGFTATIRVRDLSTASLLNTLTRTQSSSLLWVFRFTNGYQDAAAAARWNLADGFTFGYNDYATGSAPCTAVETGGDKCILYPGDELIQGDVDQVTGTIRLMVPKSKLRALSGPTGHGQRPAQVPATAGSRLYDATVFSLAFGSPIPDLGVHGFLYPLDNTPSMDFLLPAAGPSPPQGCPPTRDSDNDGLTDANELLFLTLPLTADSDLDGVKDGNDDGNHNGDDDEDEDDDDGCPDGDSDGDGRDDEDEDD